VSLHVAVVGKGGSGKSVLAGTLARVLARRGHRVLTLDSDLMPGLSLSLGLGIDSCAMLTDAVEKHEGGRWRLRKGIGPVRAINRYAVEAPDGVRHLQLGKLGREGQKAIMGSTNGFYQVIHRVGRTQTFEGWTIVGDLPAGPRQLAYRWAPYADTFLLMVEPSWKSVLTARRIASIVRSGRGATLIPIASKVLGPDDRRRVEEMLGERVGASIPADDAVMRAEREGLAPIDRDAASPAVQAIAELATNLERGALRDRRAA
jgi:CO dehydrogenase maturation factor